MASINKYFIGPSLLGDIRRTINRVDSETYRVNGGMRREVHQEMMQPPGGASLRLCSWTATWYESSSIPVTFSNSGGVTATATNVFFGVGPGAGWVAKDAGVWKLVSVRLSDQPGYDVQKIQLLGHNSNIAPCETECSSIDYQTTLQWYSITTCATATASP
jgi:hypothetical protein